MSSIAFTENNRSGMKLVLPIAIMAHNEEKVIRKAVESALNQNAPPGYSVKVVVVANACTDRTEDIVNRMREQYPNRVQLVSISEKGKTRAINEAIKLFEELSIRDLEISYVIFLDADCEFVGSEVLVNFLERFETNPKLAAVGATCLPDVLFNPRKDLISEVYRAAHHFAQSIKVNSISGMCYGIRFDILRKIDFPNFPSSDDRHVCSRLDGWFLKDSNIQIVFKTPSSLWSEINRRTRQHIYHRRFLQFYSNLKKRGITFELFTEPLGDKYRWGHSSGKNFLVVYFNLPNLRMKFYVFIYELIRLTAKIKARKNIKEQNRNEHLDYWKVER